MTIDWDKPIETTEGLPARLISGDYRMSNEPYMLVQIEQSSESVVRAFNKNGSPYWAEGETIRNRKTKREGWINIYRTGTHGSILKTEEDAKTFANYDTVATVKIEWEE